MLLRRERACSASARAIPDPLRIITEKQSRGRRRSVAIKREKRFIQRAA